MVINQYEIFWVDLEPTRGSEIKKKRPCVIISPVEMNKYLNTIIIAPMTTKSHNYPTRLEIDFDGKIGWIVLDQIRCIDKTRLMEKAGVLTEDITTELKGIIKEMLVD